MTTTSSGKPAAAALLDRIVTPTVYRRNPFTLTGLAVDASTAEIRRKRDAVVRRARVSGADFEGLAASFATLERPRERLIHELFAPWQPSTPQHAEAEHHQKCPHDETISHHAAVLETQLRGEPIDVSARTDAVEGWFAVLTSEQVTSRFREKAKQSADPRAGSDFATDIVAALPAVLLGIEADLAVVAAVNGDRDTAHALARVVATSPWGSEVGLATLRSRSEQHDARIQAACVRAENEIAQCPARGTEVGVALLEEVEKDLRVVRALLEGTSDVTAAIENRVAVAVNAACVAHFNEDRSAFAVGSPLKRSLELAHEEALRTQIERNLEKVHEGEVAEFIGDLTKAGRVNTARDTLWLLSRRTNDEGLQRQLKQMLDNPRAVMAPVHEAPAQFRLNGFGLALYGEGADDGATHIRTHCVSALWVPIIAISAFVSDGRYIQGKVPLGWAARVWRVAVPLLLALWMALGHLWWPATVVLGLVMVTQSVLWLSTWRRVTRWVAGGPAPVEPRSESGFGSRLIHNRIALLISIGVAIVGTLVAIVVRSGYDADLTVAAYQPATTQPALTAPRPSTPSSGLPTAPPGPKGLRPSSGQMIATSGTRGDGILSIENGSIEDAYATLANGTRLVRAVYVQAGQTATVSDVPDGTYTLYYALGSGWNEDLRSFASQDGVSRFDQTFTFTSSDEQYDGWRVTLTGVPGGNASVSDVGESDVPR